MRGLEWFLKFTYPLFMLFVSLCFASKRTWQVRYNAFHDQLVLTAGSDARVVLSSAASLSSEPFGKLISDDKDNEEGNTHACTLPVERQRDRKIGGA